MSTPSTLEQVDIWKCYLSSPCFNIDLMAPSSLGKLVHERRSYGDVMFAYAGLPEDPIRLFNVDPNGIRLPTPWRAIAECDAGVVDHVHSISSIIR